MNGSSQSRTEFEVHELLSTSLLEFAQSVLFPWPEDRPLNGAVVGQGLFRQRSPTTDWDVPQIKTTLTRLSQIGLENVRHQLDKFPLWVRNSGADGGDLSGPDRNIGMIAVLDQGAKSVCKGVNSRYSYGFFQQIPMHTIKYISSHGVARLKDWEAAGVDKHQAMMRAVVMIGSLVESEDPDDQDIHVQVGERLREEYERLTRTRDPYRQSFSQDIEDIDLYGRMLDEGPPQDKNVRMPDVIYWMLRFYISNVAFLRHFGRSPFQNIALGRNDTVEELQWLKALGVDRTEEDEKVREMIKDDIKEGQWRPLQL